MKTNILYILMICLLLSFSKNSMATHIIGGELYYTQLDSGQYEVTLKVYRDCYNGVPWFDTPARIKVFDANDSLLFIHYMYDYTFSELDPYLDSLCVVIPPNVCVEEAIYTDTLLLPSIPGGYQMSYTRCCRNNTILNIVGPDTTGITIHSVIPETNLDSVIIDTNFTAVIDPITLDTQLIATPVLDSIFEPNSNPRFNNFPPILICAGEPLIFDHSASDPDGDSIVYSLCSPLEGGNIPNIFGVNPVEAPPYNPVVWNPPYSPSDPLGGIPLSIDANGLLTGTPNTIGQFVVGVCASEYRDGVFLSVNRRDFQFNVAPCLPVPTAALPANMLVCADSNNTVEFEIESILNSITFHWDFGDLTTLADTSSLQIPTYTYPDTGYYDIQLIVNKGYTCEDTGYAMVYVQPGAEASFTYQNACFPNPIQLQSTAFAQGGVLTGVEWLLEPGITSPNFAETYAFNQSGVYPISHVATNSYGCRDTVTQYVQQYEKPIANFSADTTCLGSSTSFISTSQFSTSNIYLHSWDFGDGNSAFGSVVNHQYLGTGTYAVSLAIENGLGCKDTIAKDIVVADIPQASYASVLGCVGDPTVLLDNSTGASPIVAWEWWSDSIQEGSVDQNATFYFTASGNFDMQLKVTNLYGCVDSIVQTLDVYYDPVADFSFTEVCFQDTNYFFDQSSVQASSISSYQWLFDGLGTSNTSNSSFPFPQAGSYTVSLIVSSVEGCIDTTTSNVNVFERPQANFSTTPVCLNDTILFFDSSTVASGSIINWTWDFGNGQNSGNPNPTTVYDAPGNYTIHMSAESNEGCIGYTSQDVAIVALPIAQFDFENVCEGQTVNLVDQSIAQDTIVAWTWNINGADTINQSLLNYDFGTYGENTIALIIETNSGCRDTALGVVEVYPNPVAAFDTDSDCDGNQAAFVSTSSIAQGNITNWNWDFGDGATGGGDITTHIYGSNGAFDVTLIVETDEGCTDTIQQQLFNLEPPVAVFDVASDKGCVPLVTSISAAGSGQDLTYQWIFTNGLVSTDSVVNLTFDEGGVVGLSLVVTNLEGCSDSVALQNMFTIYENPTADFEISPEEASVYEPGFQFYNRSSVSSILFNWEFGDGISSSSYEPYHEYPDTGMYDVSLIVKNVFGCTDTVSRPVRVSGDYFVYYIPNSFTPNENNLNDIFNGRGVGVDQFHMYIYNRWGNLIFDTMDKSEGWNGVFQGQIAPIGTYIYRIEITDVLGEEHKFIGHVNLVR